MSIFGVPVDDERLMLELTQGLFGAGDPEYMGDFTSPAELAGSILQKFTEYFDAVTADRRAHPTDDLATVIANGTIDGEYLEDAIRFWYFVIVATAGHDTTSFGLSGGVELALRNQDQLAELKADRSLINPAVDEMLRLTSPVRSFFRYAEEDAVLADGLRFAKGDAVLDLLPLGEPRRGDLLRPDGLRHPPDQPAPDPDLRHGRPSLPRRPGRPSRDPHDARQDP